MNRETLQILEEAICDTGCWRGWTASQGLYAVEFGDCQLCHVPQAPGNLPWVTVILRFHTPILVAVLERRAHGTDFGWYEQLRHAGSEPHDVAHEDFTLTDPIVFKRILTEATHIKFEVGSHEQANENAGALLAFWTNEGVGLAVKATAFEVITPDGAVTEDQVLEMARQWREYWQEHSRSKSSNSPFPANGACPAAISVNAPPPPHVSLLERIKHRRRLIISSVATLVLLVALALTVGSLKRGKESRECRRGMAAICHQAGLWAIEREGLLPSDLLFLTNGTPTPRVLVCPGDRSREPAVSWATLTLMSLEVHIDWQGQTHLVGRLHAAERGASVSFE